MLQIDNLLKKYGDKSILDIPSLNISPGIVHLKGINGSGKSTFSKIVAGIIPFSGEILLHGSLSPVKDKIAYRKAVNYSPSEPSYPDFLTSNDMISFVGLAKGASEIELNTIIEIFGIDAYRYDAIGTYSSGMLKRLSLCLAFLGNPSLILLDEPFNTLDTTAIATLKNLIGERRNAGVNFILVSHQDIGQYGVTADATYLVENHAIGQVS